MPEILTGLVTVICKWHMLNRGSYVCFQNNVCRGGLISVMWASDAEGVDQVMGPSAVTSRAEDTLPHMLR